MNLNARSDFKIVLLGTLLYAAGSAIFYMIPPFLAFVGERLALDAEQLGTLAAAESAAIALTSLTGPLWITRIDRRAAIAFGALVCIAGNMATAFAGSFALLVASRIAVGLLGEGIVYTISYSVLGSARDTVRAFAVALTAAVVYGAAVTAGTSVLKTVFPVFGPLAGLVAIAVLVVACIGAIGPRPVVVATGPVSPIRGMGLAGLALIAHAVWFGAPGAFWTFVEQVAMDKGVATNAAEVAVSVAELVGLAGTIAAAGLGGRFGKLRPIALATAIMILSAIAYQQCSAIVGLGVCLAIFYSFWNYGTVYQMSFVSDLDAAGRSAVVMPATEVFGLSFGPYVTGHLIVSNGDGAVPVVTAIFALGGLILFLICFALLRRRHLATA
jgi:predicted MFS family arabinose efflux permease